MTDVAQPASTATHTLEIDLFEPGMGPLHRVGLAGLWMTLDAIDRDTNLAARQLHVLGEWETTSRSVTLQWHGDGNDFFRQVFAHSYRVTDREGLLYFAAYGDPLRHPSQSFAIHTAMLATFLQHPQSRKAESGKTTGTITIEDDVKPFTLRRVHEHAFETTSFSPTRPQAVAGWLLPGGAVRHVGLGQSTSLSERPGPMLALRFAPVGCLFYLVRHQAAGGPMRQQVSIVIPEVNDLTDYADLRGRAQSVQLPELYTAGPGDAALRLLSLDAARKSTDVVASRRCRVITFGTVPWSSQQRTRVSVMDVGRIAPPRLRQFDAIRRALPVRRVSVKTPATRAPAIDKDVVAAPAEHWRDVPQVPELAAENLIAGKPWWEGFAGFVSNQERREHVFRWEGKGLNEMVNNPQVMPDGPEQAFVRACHEAWRRRLGALGDRARRDGLDFGSLATREFEKGRIAFSRCKTAAEFRRSIADFWVRGGSQRELQQHWVSILPFLDERRWSAGRDLALVALASYAGEGVGVTRADAIGDETGPG